MDIDKLKKDYEQHLNDTVHLDYESDEWIIGGKSRAKVYYPDRYGTALRYHDPIAFQVGYNEWKIK